MPVVLLQAVQRSADGSNPVKVVSRWPYQAAGLADAKAFLDAYADKGRIGVGVRRHGSDFMFENA